MDSTQVRGEVAVYGDADKKVTMQIMRPFVDFVIAEASVLLEVVIEEMDKGRESCGGEEKLCIELKGKASRVL